MSELASRPLAPEGRRASGVAGSEPEEVLVVALSARALAESACRSGWRVATVDFYGDLDLRRLVGEGRVTSLGRDLGRAWSPAAAVEACAAAAAPSAAYAMDLENAPEVVAELGRVRELLGNDAATLRAVRDPLRLSAVLRGAAIRTPRILAEGARAPRGGRWLRKPRSGGGGRGVVAVPAGAGAGAGEILQERLDGPVMGLAFLADGERCRPLALSLQIEDRASFGAAGFGYCGSLSSLPDGVDVAALRRQAARAAGVVTRAFGLRGWNGMDFVLSAGEVVPLEVNPRHTSSMELWDGDADPLFAAHAAACRGRSGALEGGWLSSPAEVRGKAVLFARGDLIAGDTSRADAPPVTRRGVAAGATWRERGLADLPHPGERIARGHPVCSLFAAAGDATACLDRLRELAAFVEHELVALDPRPPRRTPSPRRQPLAVGAGAVGTNRG